MEKKVSIIGITSIKMFLLLILVSSCMSKNMASEKQTDAESEVVRIETNRQANTNGESAFKVQLKNLLNQLENFDNSQESAKEINFSDFIEEYNKLGDSDISLSDLQKQTIQILSQLEKVSYEQDRTDSFNEKNINELQGKLRSQTFLEGPPLPEQYEKKTNEALSKFFKKIQDNLGSDEERENGALNNINLEQESYNHSKSKGNNVKSFISFSLLTLLSLFTLGAFYWLYNLKEDIKKLNFSHKSITKKINNLEDSLTKKESRLSQNINELKNLAMIQGQTLESISQRSRTPINQGYVSQENLGNPSFSVSEQRKVIERKNATTTPNIVKETPASYSAFINHYKQRTSEFQSMAIGVSQTEKSLKMNLQDSSNTNVVLARDPSPNYLIVSGEANNFWLFPKYDWTPSIGTVDSFVKIFKHKEQLSSNFEVLRPACVQQTSQDEWVLLELGEVTFR